MSNEIDISILEGLSEDISDVSLESIGKSLLRQIKNYLKLEPYFQNIEFKSIKVTSPKTPKSEEIFNLGVNKCIKNNTIKLEFYNVFKKFYPFILLRELYNIYVPLDIVNYESVQLVINQIILTDLNKHHLVNEWRSLIRGNVEHYALQSTGINRLVAFDRIDNFFKLVKSKFNPTKFFFHYIREYSSLLSDKLESRDFDIHAIFFDEFEKHLQKEIINDEIVETIRCLIEIFYKTKRYHDLLSYKSYFQKLKENGQLITDLSLRKFIKNMEWVKNSTIAPSYNLNFNSINLVFVSVYLQFNPLLEKKKIFRMIENLPFLVNSLFSRKSFSLTLWASFIIPKPFLKDFEKFIKKLEDFGYIFQNNYFKIDYIRLKINLNYFREYKQKQILINPKHKQYNAKYEIKNIRDLGNIFHNPSLDLLDFLVMDRVQWFSVTGLGFERRNDVLRSIKFDLLNEVTSERTIIEDLKNSLDLIRRSKDLKNDLIQILDVNRNFGFFYIKEMLEEYVSIILLIDNYLRKNQNIKNLVQLQKTLKETNITVLIENNIILNHKHIRERILKEIVSLFFISIKSYKIQVEKFKLYSKLFSLFSNLKIYSLESIKNLLINQDLVEKVFKVKELNLKRSYEQYKSYQVTSQKIDSTLDKFLDNKPPIITPILFKTLPSSQHYNDYFVLYLTRSSENMIKIKNFENIFPELDLFLNRNKNIIIVIIYLPFLTHDEKYKLFSILYNTFKEDIIFGTTFLHPSYFPVFSLKSFYDFGRKQYFYTRDLFEQYFLYVKNTFGKKLKPIKIFPNKLKEIFWLSDDCIANLIKNINNRVVLENIDYSINYLNQIIRFHSSIQEYLLDTFKFKEIKREFFFKNYIKSIKFIPAFHDFGFGEYILYISSVNMNKIDLRLLLLNTFGQIKFPAILSQTNSLLINYIMPYGRPNRSYLNRLVKSERVVTEYCLISITKIYTILQFDFNLNPEGWIYNTDKFKIFIQNVLFNPDYSINLKPKEFQISRKSVKQYYGPSTPEYQALVKIYKRSSCDIKSYLGTQNSHIIKAIQHLLQKKLIFPFIKLKNLGLSNKIFIILPNLKPEIIEVVINIFSFFNYGFIYETQGEYFLQGESKEIKFEQGIMIKLYFPIHKHHEFISLFDLLFEYLEIKDYVILTDLAKGNELLKSVYGDLTFLNYYHPLKNLIWNEKDKIWMNIKLFNEKFKKIFPKF